MKIASPAMCLVLACFALVQVKAFGLPGAPEASPDIRLILLAKGGSNLELFFFNEGSSVPQGSVTVGTHGLSKPVTLSERHCYLALKDSAAESGFRKVGTISLPDQGKDFIVLLLPRGNEFESFLVDSDSPDFSSGRILLFNTTEMPLAAKLGDKITIAEPWTPVFALAPEAEGKSWYQVSLYYPVSGGGARIFSSTRWPYRDKIRSIVFLFRDPVTQRIVYQAIDESF